MIDKTEAMDRLIKRLEALDAPCRECDCLIGVALGWFITEPNKGWPDQLDYIDVRDGYRSYPGGGFDQLVPRFTASLDAAMTVAGKTDAEAIGVLMKAIETLECEGWPKGDWLKHLPRFICWAALCIAALRAQDALGFEIREKGQ